MEFLLTMTTANEAMEGMKNTCIYQDTEGNVFIMGKNINLSASTNRTMGDTMQESGTVTKEISIKEEMRND